MVGLKSGLVLVWCKAVSPCPGPVHARPFGLLEAQKAAIVRICHLGPGPGPQQPPGTHRNPKLTARHAFPCAGPSKFSGYRRD
eukprot:scaffold14163_cov115-Isochrysis_galbana.AAC.9